MSICIRLYAEGWGKEWGNKNSKTEKIKEGGKRAYQPSLFGKLEPIDPKRVLGYVKDLDIAYLLGIY